MPTSTARATGLLVGYLADRAWADPARAHPVAGFGLAAGRFERAVWADSRGRGLAYAGLCVGTTVLAAAAAEQASPRRRRAALVGATWSVLGGTSLARAGTAVANALEAGDLATARALLPTLCGRDPQQLDAGGLARAALESVAENTADAVVAPLLWGAVAGMPGLVGYRAVNTLDAMVGHRSPRHANFGWASARLDDAANLVPARATALLAAVLAPLVGGSTRQTLQVVVRDGGRHPSPNAGQCEAAFAGALDVTLGGPLSYGGSLEVRGPHGDGPPPTAVDLRLAVHLSSAVGAAAVVLAAALAAVVEARP